MLLRTLVLLTLFPIPVLAQQVAPDWAKVEAETLRHFQALISLDTQNPPGNETRAVEYIKKVLDAEATLDIRALPDEDIKAFFEQIRKVVNDPAVEVIQERRNTRPKAPPSRIDNEAFRALEAAVKKVYDAVTLPTMSTGATDMAYLRAKGVQCYGIGPAIDEEDGPKGFGGHSDQERILENELHRFVRFNWEVVTALAAARGK